MTSRKIQCQSVERMFTVAQKWRRMLPVFLAVMLLLPFIVTSVYAADSPKVVEAMQELKSITTKLGAPKLDGQDLYFGTIDISGNFAVVDSIKLKHNATATVFAKRGDNYVRISTNVMKDGQRAVGTVLDPAGPVYPLIKQGKSFYGEVDILGKKYDTGYEPVKSEAGDIIGVLYVGYPKD